MREALKEARKAFDLNEVPVGAVLVQNERVIARGHNQVEMLKDATAHAEMLAISAASGALENWRLLDTTLYCTLEPCAMCAGALLLSRVKRLVWSAPDLRLLQKPLMHTIEVKSGVLATESATLMQEFFEKCRKRSSRS